ncbi:MAG: glycosyltransferase [Brevinematales bacterium]|nr:glycosyltransferase [Brevinematales bacterium]
MEMVFVLFLVGSVLGLVISLVVLFRFINFFYRKIDFDRIRVDKKDISVIIPARNEENRITRLLKILVSEGFKEIIVVDDDSEDNTYEVSKSFGVKVLKVKEFYSELSGKSIACYVGASKSSGEYLLFLDADVFFSDGAFDYVLSNVPKDGLLTIQPYHLTLSFYEKLSMYFNIIAIVGLSVGRFCCPFNTKGGYFGPFLIVKRNDYFRVGGHLSVFDRVVEDIELGKRFENNNIKIYSIPNNKLVFFRMYGDGVKNLIDGWTKNMSLGAKSTDLWNLILIFGLIAFVVNITIYGFLSIFLGQFEYFAFMYLTYSFIMFLVSRKVGNFEFFSWISVVFGWFFLFILIRSFYFLKTGRKVKWRGREVVIR